MDIVFKSIAASVIRKILAGVGVYLVSSGWVKPDAWEWVVTGVITFAASVAWGIWEKYVRPELNKLPRGGE